MQENNLIRVCIADDHTLLRSALSTLINNFGTCRVVFQAGNGHEIKQHMLNGVGTDVVLMDLSMPKMDGHESALWLQERYPDVHVLMLTMYDSELTLIRLLQAGVKGFLKKDIDPSELKHAIQSVMQGGYYYSSSATGRLVNLFRNSFRDNTQLQNVMLSEQELEFLKYTCTDLTYKEIAQKMKLKPRGVDNLRDHLFPKLDVKSRVGLAMIAIRNGVVTL